MRNLLLGVVLCLGCAVPATSQQTTSCAVQRIVDGDTFYCQSGLKVRLIGIDAPERGQGRWYDSSTTALRGLLMKGQTVRLELDLDPTDRYGRTLAWVWAGDSLVNETMVARGRAVMFTVPPNVRYIDRIRTAQILARRDGLGLHGSGALECEPVQFRRRECGGKAESP